MQYFGGKAKIAKYIVPYLEGVRKENQIFVEPFVGGANIVSQMSGKRKAYDFNEYLIEMYKGVQNGYELPDSLTEEEYKYIREHKDEDKVLSGFVGFGCSFGGKWFGGYARNKTGTNYALQSKKSLLKDMNNLMDAEFICKDYREVELPNGCVVYADPPYDNTTGYGKEKFNSEEFWEYMRKISKEHIVFISEQTAPNDFISIWEKPFTRTLDVNKNNQFKVTEKLFIHKCNANIVTFL